MNDAPEMVNRRRRTGLARVGLKVFAGGVGLFSLALPWVSTEGFAGERDEAPWLPLSPVEDVTARETLQVLLQMQDQLQAHRLRIEQMAADAREATMHNSAALSKGLQNLQSAFSAQQEAATVRVSREFDALQGSNRLLLKVAGALAGMAALAMLALAFFQWRMTKAWAGLSTALAMPRLADNDLDMPLLGAAGLSPSVSGKVEQSNRELIGAVGQLERRIEGLEKNLRPTRGLPGTTEAVGDNGGSGRRGNGKSAAEAPAASALGNGTEIHALLTEGQARLKQNEFEAAIQCFDGVLSLSPSHSEALVKKGAALERLKKLNEAFECYDQAIVADPSMTIAYLHKGGLCNRLERFKEALECYEKALQTHEEWRR
jgi:tetratricopeptide (TPR) repeat protein